MKPILSTFGESSEWPSGMAVRNWGGSVHQLWAHGCDVLSFLQSGHLADVLGSLWEAGCFQSWGNACTWFEDKILVVLKPATRNGGTRRLQRSSNTHQINQMVSDALEKILSNLRSESYLSWLRRRAAVVNPHFQSLVAAHVEEHSVRAVHKRAPIKGAARMQIKRNDYVDETASVLRACCSFGVGESGDGALCVSPGGMLDIVRCSLVYADANELLKDAQRWMKKTIAADGAEVVRVKNPFHPSFETHDDQGGCSNAGVYRDIKLARAAGPYSVLPLCVCVRASVRTLCSLSVTL